jgi:hypothetical protein
MFELIPQLVYSSLVSGDVSNIHNFVPAMPVKICLLQAGVFLRNA